MDLDLRQIIYLARRWWWLLVLAPLLGVGLAYVAASRQEPLYAATATIMVNPVREDAALDYGTIQGGQSLATTYQQLIGTWPVLERVIGELDLPYGVGELQGKIATSVVPDTLLIQITVSDPNPEQAAAIANAVSQQFGDYITLQAMSARVNIAPAVPAQPPAAPYAPRLSLYLALGAILGLLAAIAAIGLLVYRDTTVKMGTDFQLLTGSPLLSAVPRDRRLRHAESSRIYFLAAPNSQYAEAIRLLRAKVVPTGVSRARLCLAITSPERGDGKSTVTANLAVALAQAGAMVVVVDANFRSPSQHRLFGIENDRGLTTLLANPSYDWRWASFSTRVPNVTVIPSGLLYPNAVDLLDGGRLQQILTEIGDECDVILLDTPAILDVSDGLAVASNADAALLVCYAGRTSQSALRRAAATLGQGGVSLAGVVLNHQFGQGGQEQQPALVGASRRDHARWPHPRRRLPASRRRHPPAAREQPTRRSAGGAAKSVSAPPDYGRPVAAKPAPPMPSDGTAESRLLGPAPAEPFAVGVGTRQSDE